MQYLTCRFPIVIAVLFCVGQGCSTARVPPAGSVPVEDHSIPSETSPELIKESPGASDITIDGRKSYTVTPGSPAVVALLEQSRVEMDSGRAESAAATLERGLRMDGSNPHLWHQLALIKQRQKQWQQARSMAQKSNSLAVGNAALQLANWRIISMASEQLQDIEEMERAREMIEKLNK